MVKKGAKKTRPEKPGAETIDPERGAGESRGLGGSRLHKPLGMGMVRERLTPASSGHVGRKSRVTVVPSDSLGRLSRRPRVVPTSHDDKLRLGKIVSDPDRVSDDGG